VEGRQGTSRGHVHAQDGRLRSRRKGWLDEWACGNKDTASIAMTLDDVAAGVLILFGIHLGWHGPGAWAVRSLSSTMRLTNSVSFSCLRHSRPAEVPGNPPAAHLRRGEPGLRSLTTTQLALRPNLLTRQAFGLLLLIVISRMAVVPAVLAVFMALSATQAGAVSVAAREEGTWVGDGRGMFAGQTYKSFPIVRAPCALISPRMSFV
jgi:hypothetical protein